MNRHQIASGPDTQMLVTSPRCSLNCHGLSMHLPPLGDRRNHSGSYISPPMSASYNQIKFSERNPIQYSNYNYPSSTGSSHTRSPTAASAIHVNKSLAKDARSELSTPSSTDTLSTSVLSGSEKTKVSGDWTDELSSSNHDSPDGQLVPGPPGIARRAKAHVPSACVNCKKKHLACETKRPCNRCVVNGKEASCVDVQHKKRGRPRLREDDSFRDLALGGEPAYGDVYQTQAGVLAPTQPGRHRSKTYRELRSQPETPYVDQRPRTSDPTYMQNQYLGGGQVNYINSTPTMSYSSHHTPIVLLTPDFVVAQHNRAFSEALSLQVSARGQTLSDLVIPSEREKIRRLQVIMRNEHQNAVHSARKHGALNSLNTMPAVEQLDITRATSGFQTMSEYWTFRLPRDQSRGFPISISLAKDGGHFIILTLIHANNSAQSLSSPPYVQQSMAMSTTMTTGMPSPPHSLYQDHQTSRNQQSKAADLAMPYLTSNMTPSFEDQLMPFQPSHGLAQYKAASPPRSVQIPYGTPRTNSSSSNSASLSGSEIPRSSPGHQNQPLSRENLMHLQLPPIRTTPTSDPRPPKDPGQRRRPPTSTPSPARSSTHSGKRKKRRRVEVGDLVH